MKGKKREYDTALKGWYYWPGKFIKLKSAEYSRNLDGVIWVAIGFIAFGTFIFSRPKMFKYEWKLSLPSAIWYSLGLFLPFVTLGVDKLHRIEKKHLSQH